MPRNDFEGDYKRVLCVCSANLLRSPTAALVLSQEPFNFNTRSAGIGNYALIQPSYALISWANEIICMEQEHKEFIIDLIDDADHMVSFGKLPTIISLDIPDDYSYRDPILMKLIVERYTQRATI